MYIPWKCYYCHAELHLSTSTSCTPKVQNAIHLFSAFGMLPPGHLLPFFPFLSPPGNYLSLLRPLPTLLLLPICCTAARIYHKHQQIALTLTFLVALALPLLLLCKFTVLLPCLDHGVQQSLLLLYALISLWYSTCWPLHLLHYFHTDTPCHLLSLRKVGLHPPLHH